METTNTRECYAFSEAYYHMYGGKEAGLTPIQGKHEGISHWAIRCEDGTIIDLTVDQFETVPDYTTFRGRGFLTKEPSKAARVIIERWKAYGY